jgi:hypothetical protein
MLGAGGLWMLQNRSSGRSAEAGPEQDELQARLALLERIAAAPAAPDALR